MTRTVTEQMLAMWQSKRLVELIFLQMMTFSCQKIGLRGLRGGSIAGRRGSGGPNFAPVEESTFWQRVIDVAFVISF